MPTLSADKVTSAASSLVEGFDSLLFHQVRQGGRCGQGAGLGSQTSPGGKGHGCLNNSNPLAF
jgi:hypothetical protein